MNGYAMQHPSDSELRAFDRGESPAERVEPIAEHVADCPQCRAVLEECTPAPAIAKLRASQKQGAEPQSGSDHVIHFVQVRIPHRTEPEEEDERAFLERQLPQFKILSRIGEGGMGEVFLAEDVANARRVALKVIRRHFSADNRYRQRFEEEGRILRALNHPNVVRYFESPRIEGRLLIVMEYVRGERLRDVLKRCGKMSVPEAVASIRPIVKALQYISEAGVIHRDLKPENAIVALNGEIKLVDFGIAKDTFDPRTQALTELGTFLGTPAYMSPEQASNPAEVDIRSDIYSAGCIFYELLTGRPPFSGNRDAILLAHRTETPKPPHEWVPEIPRSASRLVQRMLKKSPAQRFESPREVLLALSRLDVPQRRSLARRIGFATLLLSALALFGGFGWYLLQRNSAGRPDPATSSERSPAILPPSDPALALGNGVSWMEGDTLKIRGGNGRQLLLLGAESWEDYIFEVDVRRVSGHEGPLLFFRTLDGRQDYDSLAVGRYDGRFLERRTVIHAVLQPDAESIPFEIRPDRWYRVRLDVRGADLDCGIDDVRVFKDLLVLKHTRGRIGIGVERDCECAFRNPVVVKTGGEVLLRGWAGVPR